MNSIFFIILILFFLSSSIPSSSILFPKEAHPTKSGYLPITTTSSSSSSSLFFAFYEAQRPVSHLSQTPLLIWLQGGPGCSSMLGNFFELGPHLVAHHNTTLHPNPFSWNRRFGLLFIDNPIGSGFSIASTPNDIPRNQSTVASHLITALKSFTSSNPSFKSRPIYITGESYAGKYVPAFGYYVLQHNSQLPGDEKIKLSGVAIGNGLTHPIAQVATLADSAYFTGLVNARQKAILEELQDRVVRLTKQEKWSEATDARIVLQSRLQNMTGLATLEDLRKKTPYESDMVGIFLNNDEVKEALGAEKSIRWVECSDDVNEALHEDVMKSVKFMVEELVKKSRVLLYQGLFDLKDGVVSTEAWVKEMEWEGLKSFLEAEREVWKVKGELAGYVQQWGTLTNVVVSGAGHLVPADQGRSSQAMIEDWVMENGLFGDASSVKKATSTIQKAGLDR